MRLARFVLAYLLLPAVGLAQVVISQVYGGGGNAGATYKNDFIELFNRGTSAVDVSMWSVQHAASTGTTWQMTNLSGTIQPGHFYLVQEGVGAGGTVNLPTPDATGAIAMSATAAKVALISSQTLIANGTSCPTVAVVDLVGYGTGTNCFEGSGPTATLTNTTAALRASVCTDTNNNAVDFSVGAPNPRNSAAATNLCGGPPPLTITTASPLPAATVGQSYSVAFVASGGSGVGYSFSRASGTFPPGLNLAGATLSGTPTTNSGSPYSFTIQVIDSGSNTVSKPFQLTVNPGATCVPTNTIAQIQGNGNASPVAGNVVTTSGIVTGLKSNGFFIQMPSPGDADPTTSDGVFVFTSSAPPAAAAVGNSVCVTGKVQEFVPSSDPNSPSQTEIAGTPTVFAVSTANPLPAPVVLATGDTNPAGALLELEKYEGMRVEVNSMTVVAPTGGTVNEPNATSTTTGYFYGVITGIARPFREAGVQLPDPLPAGSPCCVPRWDANPEILGVNTKGQTGGTPLDVVAGSTVTNVIGPLDYSGRTFTINPDPGNPPVVTSGSIAYTAVPAPTSAELTVACFNLERFYDTVNDPGTSDVVLTATAFANRLHKASLAIRNVLRYPDVLGVEEMENLTTLQSLATQINNDAVTAGDPNPNYQAYLSEGNDVGGIDVGFLVKTPKVSVSAVTQVGLNTTYIEPGGTNAILNDRPPLVLDASVTRAGSDQALPFTVIVNHLRSLDSIDDPTDGARVRAKREAQAEFLANYIEQRMAADSSANIVSVGDYNAFQFNDGYADVMGVIKGTPAPADQVVVNRSPVITNPPLTDLADTLASGDRYSYTFSGSAQILDHVLVNPNFLARLSRFAYGRVDADFPEAYRSDPNRPERISDHDPAVAYFTMPLSHTQYQLTIEASPTAGGTVTPASGGFYDSGTVVPIRANAAAGYQFTGWTGPVSNPASPSTTVTMSAALSVTAGFTVNSISRGLGFYPVTPCRVADTRAGVGMTGAFGPPSMAGQSTRDFPIPLSACNIPAFAQAYSLNVTVVPPAPLIYLSIWPAGQPQPLVSTLNSFDGAVVANAAIVPAGTDGAISVYVSDPSDVIIDINGYFAPPDASALAFYPVTPCRVADTRGATGTFGGPLIGGGQTRNFTIPFSGCVIPSAAQAYSLNMTVVPPGPLIYLSTWPTGQPQPTVSTLNAFDGRVAANAAIVPAGQNGAISVFVSDPSNVIIDVNGYFAPSGNPGALYFYAATPCRIADTRGNGFSGAFGPPSMIGNASRDFPLQSSTCGTPAAAQAYSLNMTVVPPAPLIYLTTWPANAPQPLVSTLNSFQGKVVANAAIVPAGQDGAISVFVSDATQLIIDVNGYFAQ